MNAETQRRTPITEDEVRLNLARYAEFLEAMRWLIEEDQFESEDTAENLADALNLVRVGGESVGMAFWKVGLPTKELA